MSDFKRLVSLQPTYFSVPNRILFNEWEEFKTGGQTNMTELQKLIVLKKQVEADPNFPKTERMIEIAQEEKTKVNKQIYQLKQQIKRLDQDIEHLKLLLQPKLFNDGEHL